MFFFFSQGNPLFILYGILTLTLCGGDAFHLVPRILRAVRGSNDKIKRQLGIGLQVSSITMTVFYIILMYIWKLTFPELAAPVSIEAVVWISAIVRIVICLFPQNNWCSEEGNLKLSVIRNAVFAVTGIGIIILYAMSGNTYGYHMTRMVAAIIISFGCYLPVTLFSKTKPKCGSDWGNRCDSDDSLFCMLSTDPASAVSSGGHLPRSLSLSADYFSGNSIYLIIQLSIQYSPFAGRQPDTLSLSGIFSDIEYLS